MEHLDTFLAAHPPFDALAPDELRAIAAQAVEHVIERGTAVLVEDGAPAEGLWVIRIGSRASAIPRC
jgi:signal-transduction protein with cAMP-binding, CBS, and nucleotidyltransferase domain